MSGCEICGGRFAENKCAYCNKSVCSSCMISEGSRCMKCINRSSVPLKPFIRRIYPFPFLVALGFNVDISAIQPVLIATIVLAIPFIIMLRVWQKRPPR